MKIPNINDNLEHLNKCPICSGKYQSRRILILEEAKDKTTFHLTCDKCNSASLVIVSMNQFGIVSLGMMTDLKSNEVHRLFRGRAISADQVLDVHQFFKNFKGGARELL